MEFRFDLDIVIIIHCLFLYFYFEIHFTYLIKIKETESKDEASPERPAVSKPSEKPSLSSQNSIQAEKPKPHPVSHSFKDKYVSGTQVTVNA